MSIRIFGLYDVVLMATRSDLERAVEELSELIEAPIDPETIMTLRQKVTDKTVRTYYALTA